MTSVRYLQRIPLLEMNRTLDELIRQTYDREGLFCPHYISFIHIKVMVYVIRIRRTRRLTFSVILVVGHILISFVSHEIVLFNRRVKRAFTSCMEVWYLKKESNLTTFLQQKHLKQLRPITVYHSRIYIPQANRPFALRGHVTWFL